MTRSISILAVLLLLSACAASDGSGTSSRSAAADELPLALNWGQNGYGEGFIVKPVPNTTGNFRLKLYYRDPFSASSTGVVNRCFGHWDTQPSAGDTGQTGSGGYWQINCASGRRAEGTFVFGPTGEGQGQGIDPEGNQIQLVIRAPSAASQ